MEQGSSVVDNVESRKVNDIPDLVAEVAVLVRTNRKVGRRHPSAIHQKLDVVHTRL